MPPFGFDVDEYLAGYASALLVATKIVPETRGIPISESRTADPPRTAAPRSAPARNGTALRRPIVRLRRNVPPLPRGELHTPRGKTLPPPRQGSGPSLEPCGFDIARTTSELFGIDLKWGSEGRIPEYLTLVCGFFHNADSVIWTE